MIACWVEIVSSASYQFIQHFLWEMRAPTDRKFYTKCWPLIIRWSVSSLVSFWPKECLTNYWSEESQASLGTWWGGRCLLPSCFWTVIAQWGITPVQSTPALHWVIHLRYRNTWQIRNDKTEQRVLSQSQSIWFGQFSYFVTRHPFDVPVPVSHHWVERNAVELFLFLDVFKEWDVLLMLQHPARSTNCRQSLLCWPIHIKWLLSLCISDKNNFNGYK